MWLVRYDSLCIFFSIFFYNKFHKYLFVPVTQISKGKKVISFKLIQFQISSNIKIYCWISWKKHHISGYLQISVDILRIIFRYQQISIDIHWYMKNSDIHRYLQISTEDNSDIDRYLKISTDMMFFSRYPAIYFYIAGYLELNELVKFRLRRNDSNLWRWATSGGGRGGYCIKSHEKFELSTGKQKQKKKIFLLWF